MKNMRITTSSLEAHEHDAFRVTPRCNDVTVRLVNMRLVVTSYDMGITEIYLAVVCCFLEIKVSPLL